MKQNKFKDTEIGKIPKDWDVKKLSEFCNILMGQSPPSSTYNLSEKGLPFFQGRKDFGMKYPIKTMWCSEPSRIADVGDVLLSVRAPVGDVNVAVEKCCIGRGLSALSMKKGGKDFLYYLIFHNQQRLKQIFESEGTVFGCVTKDGLKDFEVTLPVQKSEQHSISKILSDLDSKIELNQQMNKILEAIGQALFKHWFVDFEFPNDEGKPYMSSGGEMVDSELGGIPKRWKIGVITDITEILSGFAFKSSHFVKHGKYRLVTIKNVQDGYFKKNTKDGLEKIPQKMPEYCKLKLGDILLSLTGNVGRICQVIGKNYLLNQRVAKLQPRRNQNHAFVYLFFRQRSILSLLENISSGTAQQNLSPVQTGNIKIVIPNREILDNFGNITNFFYTKILENNIQIQALTKIRDLLLPRLMSGRIRVPVG